MPKNNNNKIQKSVEQGTCSRSTNDMNLKLSLETTLETITNKTMRDLMVKEVLMFKVSSCRRNYNITVDLKILVSIFWLAFKIVNLHKCKQSKRI